MKKTLETKLQILNNFIDHIETVDKVKNELLKDLAQQYVSGTPLDEIKQAFNKEIKNQYKIVTIETGEDIFKFNAVDDAAAIIYFKDWLLQAMKIRAEHNLVEQLNEGVERSVKII